MTQSHRGRGEGVRYISRHYTSVQLSDLQISSVIRTTGLLSCIRVLRHSELDQVHWEAAKALGAIGDAGSIRSLVLELGAVQESTPVAAYEIIKRIEVNS